MSDTLTKHQERISQAIAEVRVFSFLRESGSKVRICDASEVLDTKF